MPSWMYDNNLIWQVRYRFLQESDYFIAAECELLPISYKAELCSCKPQILSTSQTQFFNLGEL